jgi:hypothetical protein
MVTLTLGTAGPTKRQIVELAFGDIGSAGYEFGRTPEEVTDALLRMNALMLAPEARKRLTTGMALLHAAVAIIPTMPLAAQTPRGAGARWGFGPFIAETADDV